MKITGWQLRDALSVHTLRKEAAEKAFNGTLKAFPGEKKETPQEVVAQLATSELAIVKLQVAQMRYNLAVTVEVEGESMTLAEAVKRVGYTGRIEKMWKGTIEDTKPSPYESPYDTRDTASTIVRSERTIASKDAVRLTTEAGKRARALRTAVNNANGREVEIESLDRALFE